MISAQEARKKSNSKKDIVLSCAKRDVERYITEASTKGDYEVSVYVQPSVLNEMLKWLNENGYKTYTISGDKSDWIRGRNFNLRITWYA